MVPQVFYTQRQPYLAELRYQTLHFIVYALFFRLCLKCDLKSVLFNYGVCSLN